MADDWTKKIMKYFIIIINTIVFLGGLCLAGVGGYAAFNKNSLLRQLAVDLQSNVVMTGLYILLAVGLFMATLALVGCIGAARESRLLLGIYFFFVLLILILEIAAIILCFTKLKIVEAHLLKTLKGGSTKSKGTMNDAFSQLFKSVFSGIEEKKRCCGLRGPADYGHTVASIPKSCYSPVSKQPIGQQVRISKDTAQSAVELGEGDSDIERNKAQWRKQDQSLINSAGGTVLAQTSRLTTSSNQATVQTPAATTTTATKKIPTPQASTTTISAVTVKTPATTTTTTEKIPTPQASTTTISAVTVKTPETSTTRMVTTTTTTTQSTLWMRNTTAVKVVTAAPASSTGSPTKYYGILYNKGCMSILNPIIYAAGGIAIGILLLEILLLIFTGLLLAGMHSGYKSLA